VTVAITLFPDMYVDSVVQLRCIRAMRELDGVAWASAGWIGVSVLALGFVAMAALAFVWPARASRAIGATPRRC